MNAVNSQYHHVPSRVISASRRMDMVGTRPAHLAQVLEEKAPPHLVHTIVLWTKNPAPIFEHKALHQQLIQYDQIFLHLSLTGLGSTVLEPKVPAPDKILESIPELITFLGDARRLRIRFDPIIKVKMPEGHCIENLSFFATLAPQLSALGVRDVTTSWVQVYGKVAKRLASHGIRIIQPTKREWQDQSDWLQKTAHAHDITLHGCCVPGWPRSRCIDGPLLTELHPYGATAQCERASGQRPRCGCTKSWDIGWYYKCAHGCLYCYGQPVDYLAQKEKITVVEK